jgi:hypothetical protein
LYVAWNSGLIFAIRYLLGPRLQAAAIKQRAARAVLKDD